eukprot:252333_1
MFNFTLSICLAFTLSLTHAISRFNVENSTCEEDHDLCVQDITCNATRAAMADACYQVLNNIGNDTHPIFEYPMEEHQQGRCPEDCQTALDTYLQYLYPTEVSTDYCECESSECEYHKQQLYDQRCIASDCAALWDNCITDTNGCKPYADAYHAACAPFGFWNDSLSWSHHFCPEGCAEALDAYVSYIQPNYTSLRFCDCNGDELCEQYKDNLESADCATPGCGAMFNDCIEDPQCIDTAEEYLENCMYIINGSWAADGNTWCPDECKLKLQAYIDQVSPGATTTDFCTCESDGCHEGKANLLQVGCVANDCTASFASCLEDSTCEPIATDYLDACAEVIAGNWTENWCPTDCREKLAAYIEVALTSVSNDNPLDFCDCNGHIACVEGRDRLISATCFNVGCGKLHEIRCSSDECLEDHMNYIMSCQGMVNGSWTEPWCPLDCQQNLFTYLAYMVEPGQDMNDIHGICQCAESNGDCAQYFVELIDHGCVKESCQSTWLNCQNDATCQPLSEEYLTACETVIDGSFTGDTCPGDCPEKLATYLGAALSVDALLSDEFCDCQGEASCTEPLERIKELDCVRQSCEYQFAVCEADSNCNPFAMEQQEHCAVVFNGSTTVCPHDCRVALGEYLEYMYPEVPLDESDATKYCACDADNTECAVVQGYINAANCIDSEDCTYRHYKCEMDSTCAPLATAYLTACEDIIEDADAFAAANTECPADCATKLEAYLDAIYGLEPGKNADEYCNCNGHEICEDVMAAYVSLDCFGFLPTTTALVVETTKDDTPGSGSSANQITIDTVLVFGALMKVFVM